MKKRAIFLDKDGTLIVNVPYNTDPDKIELMPGVDSLKRLSDAGYRFVVITNQAGIAHGYFPEGDLQPVQERLCDLLWHSSVKLDGFYYCPHHPDGRLAEYRQTCECRKPRPGLLQRAAKDLKIDLHSSWFLGDILDDVEAGNLAGCQTMLVDVGSETQWHITADRLPDFQVNSLSQAVETILLCDAENAARAG